MRVGVSFSRALEIAEADKISSQQYLGGIVLHIVGMILSISKNKIFEVGDVDQKIEQAKIIMNENVFKDIDPEELAMKLNISYSWFGKYSRTIQVMHRLNISRN